MLKITASPQDTDDALERAAQEALDRQQPIRIRIQPMLYAPGKTAYASWPRLSWTVECADLASANALRMCLETFMETLGKLGVETMLRRLAASGDGR